MCIRDSVIPGVGDDGWSPSYSEPKLPVHAMSDVQDNEWSWNISFTDGQSASCATERAEGSANDDGEEMRDIKDVEGPRVS